MKMFMIGLGLDSGPAAVPGRFIFFLSFNMQFEFSYFPGFHLIPL